MPGSRSRQGALRLVVVAGFLEAVVLGWNPGPLQERLTGPGVEVRYPSSKRGLAIEFLNAFPAAAQRVRVVTGAVLPEPVVVELVSSLRELQERVRAATGEALPEWVAGVALPRHALILIRTDLRGAWRERVPGLLIHELGHLGVAARLRGGGAAAAPRWLDEGIAQHAEGRPLLEDVPDLAMRAFFGQLIPLAELGQAFPASEGATALAYAQAESFVRFLAHFPGAGGTAALLDRLALGEPLDIAVRRLTLLSLEELEARWQAGLRSDQSWVLGLLGKVALGLALLVAVVLGASRMVRRRQAIEGRWDAEEEGTPAEDLPDSPRTRPPARRPVIRRFKPGEEEKKG